MSRAREVGTGLVDIIPVVGRSLRDTDAAEGWDFDPGVRVGLHAEQSGDT
jgi:hypothetical protein